jgi:hypothetical protein
MKLDQSRIAIVCGLAMGVAGAAQAQNYEVRFGAANTQEIAYGIAETQSAGSVAVGSIDTRGGDIYAARFNALVWCCGPMSTAARPPTLFTLPCPVRW